MDRTNEIPAILKELGIEEINKGVSTGTEWFETTGDVTSSSSPIDNKVIAKVKNATLDDYENVIKTAQEAFKKWRAVPAPVRGEVVRQIGLALREKKEALGALVTWKWEKSIRKVSEKYRK